MKKAGGREAEHKQSSATEIRLASEELTATAKLEESHTTLILLSLSNSLLHILDKIGPTMAVLRHDVHKNIERLEKINLLDPSLYSSLEEILKKEVDEGTARKRESCSRAVLWLTRSMDFSQELLERLEMDSLSSLQHIVEESYSNTLKPWHGWISSAAYKIALKLIPGKEDFLSLLTGSEQDQNLLKSDIQTLVSLLRPFLEETHALLVCFLIGEERRLDLTFARLALLKFPVLNMQRKFHLDTLKSA